MSSFKTLKFTNDGLSLKVKCEFEKTLKLLKFKIGDGALNGKNPRELHDLINTKMDNIEVIKCIKIENKKIEVTGYINNENVEAGFYWREIGIFAEDPDTQEEILLCYSNSEEFADYIPDKTSQNERYIKLIIAVSDDIEVKINTNSNIYITQEEINAFENKVETKITTFEQEVETKINTIKQETEARAFTIETNSWEQKGELYEAVIADERVKENDLADVAFDSSTYSIAEEAGVKSYVTEETGKIRLFADSVPSGILSGKYTLSKGGGEVSGEN